MFSLNVLPGDVNQSGGVNILDTVHVISLSGSSTSTPAMYSIFSDVNGSGGINILDILATNSQAGSTLPAGTPVVPTFSSLVAAVAAQTTAIAGQPQLFSTLPASTNPLLQHRRFGGRSVLANSPKD
jgi:hypothetical protein